ncbi:MAG: hypothetical protein LC104_19090 [Bacteroidales bacterium]|nr:hypothetical protein [Bacteroidales bacterium]
MDKHSPNEILIHQENVTFTTVMAVVYVALVCRGSSNAKEFLIIGGILMLCIPFLRCQARIIAIVIAMGFFVSGGFDWLRG